jgi:hypothetical protein
VELLEGLRFEKILKDRDVKDFWNDPDSFIEGSWKEDRKQLWSILKRMLAKRELDRFENMHDVVQRLSALEAQVPGEPQTDFFNYFYEHFFHASPDSKAKFKVPQSVQNEKLMKAMDAVRDFKLEGGASFNEIVEKHRDYKITKNEFTAFHESFRLTMDNFVGGQELRRQWDDLFTSAIEYMSSKLEDK